MKIKRSFITLSILSVLFAVTSCQDNNRQNEAEVDDAEFTEAETYVQLQDDMTNDLMTTVKGNPELSTFALRMDVADVREAMEEAEGPLTVFAPNNAAYSYLYREHGTDVLGVENSAEVHFLVAEGRYDSDSLMNGLEAHNGTFPIPTLEGENMLVSMKNDSIFVRGRNGEGATLIERDIEATNGVVHIINSVILPGGIETKVILETEEQ